MSADGIPLSARAREPEREAWGEYLRAREAMHAEWPIVTIETLERVVSAYRRFHLAFTGSAA